MLLKTFCFCSVRPCKYIPVGKQVNMWWDFLSLTWSRLVVSLRPARCCVQEAAPCWRSAPCWPSSPSSCPAEAASGGSAPWPDTCRWHQVSKDTHIFPPSAEINDSVLVPRWWWQMFQLHVCFRMNVFWQSPIVLSVTRAIKLKKYI